jgi:hypothetical protein
MPLLQVDYGPFRCADTGQHDSYRKKQVKDNNALQVSSLHAIQEAD